MWLEPPNSGLAVSQQTIVLLSGMMAGAGTDYAVFLISRYHDYVRSGADSDQAVKSALSSIGKVIAASAATVGITFLGMTFARLPLFPLSARRWQLRSVWRCLPR